MAAEEETLDPEQEDGAETTQDEQEPGEEVAAEAPKDEAPSNELKVIIVLKGNSILLGAQTPNCDAIYRSFKGDLAAALQEVPAFVEQANQQWDANPRYPKANLPEEVPSPAPRETITRPVPAKPEPAQAKWF